MTKCIECGSVAEYPIESTVLLVCPECEYEAERLFDDDDLMDTALQAELEDQLLVDRVVGSILCSL